MTQTPLDPRFRATVRWFVVGIHAGAPLPPPSLMAVVLLQMESRVTNEVHARGLQKLLSCTDA